MKSFTLFLLLTGCGVKSHYSPTSKPFTHEIWSSLLTKYVNENGLVDYEGFIRDREIFDAYISLLNSNHPNSETWTEAERLAYWINAYNAYTVQLVLDHYPVQGIKDIKKEIPFINSVWDKKFIDIEGRTYDLNNIEHSILRKKFNEPRIHFAINCASISCPKLHHKAFEAATLEEQLLDVSKDFINDSQRNNLSENEIVISKIFKWFGKDFKKQGSKIDFINLYSDTPLSPEAKTSYSDYNWSLNGIK